MTFRGIEIFFIFVWVVTAWRQIHKHQTHIYFKNIEFKICAFDHDLVTQTKKKYNNLKLYANQYNFITIPLSIFPWYLLFQVLKPVLYKMITSPIQLFFYNCLWIKTVLKINSHCRLICAFVSVLESDSLHSYFMISLFCNFFIYYFWCYFNIIDILAETFRPPSHAFVIFLLALYSLLKWWCL